MDFTSLYSTRIQKTFDEDQADILKTFLAGIAKKEIIKLDLTNYYKGLPLIYSAKVLGVERGNLDLDINPQQAVAIAEDHYTLIHCKLFKFPILAHVQYVNIKKHVASLTKLCFVEVMAEKRAAVRLDLDPSVPAEIISPAQNISGKLVDISVQGVAINVDSYVEVGEPDELSIKFILPDPVLQKDAVIHVPAKLVAIDDKASPYCYKFRIMPEKHQEQLISRYSFQRQVEIIRGLKEVVD